MTLRNAAIAAAAAVMLSAPAYAGPTKTWVVDSYKDFDKGEAKSALIGSNGEVRAGYEAKAIEVDFDDSWSMVGAKNGDLFIGAGDSGVIYRVRGKKQTKFATLKGVVAVVSMALASNGDLYAGTMPGGQVWRISASGKSKLLASLKDVESVWALAISGKALYAGTGPNGKLFKVDTASGKSSVVFETDDKRITALMAAKDGSVWLGTSDKALLFRHDPKRKVTRAMADFAGNEITAITEWNGTAVVAANALKEPTTSGVKSKAAVNKGKKKNTGVKAKAPKAGTKPGAETAKAGAKPPRKGARQGKGALFRVRGDGQLTQLHALTSTYFTALAVGQDDQIYAGAGDKGRIYLIDSDDSVSTVFDVKQRVIAQMTYDAKSGLRFTTADSTALYTSVGAANKAEYLSDAFDAKATAKFGNLVWRGERLAVETRSGNTAEPGKGWSKWQAPRSTRPGAGGETRGKVTSPPGRYIQYRARFSGQASKLAYTQLYFLAQNKPTKIEEIELKLPARSTKKLLTVREKAKPRSPILEIKWKVANDDGDETVYDLRVRRDGEVRWRHLTPKDEPQTETSFKWNTETFPDGYYRLRVTASDRRSNPSGAKRETHKTSNLFVVDNQKPKIDGLSVRYPAASARASDSLSAIAEAAFSVDDGPWHVIGAGDGLYDDLSELLKLELPAGLAPGVHTLAVRVADEAGNIASTTTSFRTR